MSEHVATVLGMMGLFETITEFVYALVLRKSFTPFESVFFLTGGSFELAGELFAVALGLRYVWRATNGGEDLVDIMGVVFKDPIHNLAYPYRSAGDVVRPFLAASSVGVMVSNLPVLVWATFFPVWGGFSVDGGLRMLLSIVSLLCIANQCLLSAVWMHRGEEVPFWIRMCISCFKYALGKGIEVYLLISKSNRLASDALGTALITFQLTELASVVVVIARALTSNVYDDETARLVDRVLPFAAGACMACMDPRDRTQDSQDMLSATTAEVPPRSSGHPLPTGSIRRRRPESPPATQWVAHRDAYGRTCWRNEKTQEWTYSNSQKFWPVSPYPGRFHQPAPWAAVIPASPMVVFPPPPEEKKDDKKDKEGVLEGGVLGRGRGKALEAHGDE